MTRFLLDTGSAGDYLHRRRGVYERARETIAAGHRLGIGLPVFAELWYGVENSSSRERNAERLRRVLPELIIWPLTEPAAEYGRIAAELNECACPSLARSSAGVSVFTRPRPPICQRKSPSQLTYFSCQNPQPALLFPVFGQPYSPSGYPRG